MVLAIIPLVRIMELLVDLEHFWKSLVLYSLFLFLGVFYAIRFNVDLGINVRQLVVLPLAIMVGVLLGVFTSMNKYINSLLNPSIQFLSGVPVVVWIPFWIMVFGIGESFKIGLILISTFFMVYGSTFQAINSIGKEYLELTKLYKKSLRRS